MRSKKFLTLIGLTTGTTIASLGLTCVACNPKIEEKEFNIIADSRVVLSKTKAKEGEALEFMFKFNDETLVLDEFVRLEIAGTTIQGDCYLVDPLTADPDGWLYKVSITQEHAYLINGDINLVMTFDHRPLKISLKIDDGYQSQSSPWVQMDINECTYQSTPTVKIGSYSDEVLQLEDVSEIRVGSTVLTKDVDYRVDDIAEGTYTKQVVFLDETIIVNDIVIIWKANWQIVSIRVNNEQAGYVSCSAEVLPFKQQFRVTLTPKFANIFIEDCKVDIGNRQLVEGEYTIGQTIDDQGNIAYELSVQDANLVIDNIVVSPELSYQPLEVKVFDPQPYTPEGEEYAVNRIVLSRTQAEEDEVFEVYVKPIPEFKIKNLGVKIGDQTLSTDYTVEEIKDPESEWTHKLTITNPAIVNDDITICAINCIRAEYNISASSDTEWVDITIDNQSIKSEYEEGEKWTTHITISHPHDADISAQSMEILMGGEEIPETDAIPYYNESYETFEIHFPKGISITDDIELAFEVEDKPYQFEATLWNGTKQIKSDDVEIQAPEFKHGFYYNEEQNFDLQLVTYVIEEGKQMYVFDGIKSITLMGKDYDGRIHTKELSDEDFGVEDYMFNVNPDDLTHANLWFRDSTLTDFYDEGSTAYITGMKIEFYIRAVSTSTISVIGIDGVQSYSIGEMFPYQSLTYPIKEFVLDDNKEIGDVEITCQDHKGKWTSPLTEGTDYEYNASTGYLTLKPTTVSISNFKTIKVFAKMRCKDPLLHGFEDEDWDNLNYWLRNAHENQNLNYLNYVYCIQQGQSIVGKTKTVKCYDVDQQVRVVDTFRYRLVGKPRTVANSAPLLFEWVNPLHDRNYNLINKPSSNSLSCTTGYWNYIDPWYKWGTVSPIRTWFTPNKSSSTDSNDRFEDHLEDSVRRNTKKYYKSIICHLYCFHQSGIELYEPWDRHIEVGEWEFEDKYTIATCSDLNCSQRPEHDPPEFEDIYHHRYYDGTVNDDSNKPWKFYKNRDYPKGVNHEPIWQRLKYQYNHETKKYDIPTIYQTCIRNGTDQGWVALPKHGRLGEMIPEIHIINPLGCFDWRKIDTSLPFCPCFCM